MKSRMIIGLTLIGIICTSSIVFANDIKVLKKSDVDYIPLKKVIQKFGGKINISDNIATAIVNGKSIVIEKNLSFAKLNDNYCPFNTKEVNGIEVPVDTKPIFEKGEVYIAKDFLKNYKIVNYKIVKDNIKIILDSDKTTIQNIETNQKEEKDLKVIDNNYENLKKSNEVPEPIIPEKVQRQVRLKKITTPNRTNTKEIRNNNDSEEIDKGNIKNNIEKSNEEIKSENEKPENEKPENQKNEVPKVEASNDQQPKEQVE